MTDINGKLTAKEKIEVMRQVADIVTSVSNAPVLRWNADSLERLVHQLYRRMIRLIESDIPQKENSDNE